MCKRWFPILFVLSVSLASCASHPSSHWVTREELQPAEAPNIQSIELTDGRTIIFDHYLGWFDVGKGVVEGVTLTGWHPSIPLTQIRRVEIQDVSDAGNNTLKAIGITVLVLLLLGVVAGIIAIGQLANSGGCLVLIAVFTTATGAIALILFA